MVCGVCYGALLISLFLRFLQLGFTTALASVFVQLILAIVLVTNSLDFCVFKSPFYKGFFS